MHTSDSFQETFENQRYTCSFSLRCRPEQQIETVTHPCNDFKLRRQIAYIFRIDGPPLVMTQVQMVAPSHNRFNLGRSQVQNSARPRFEPRRTALGTSDPDKLLNEWLRQAEETRLREAIGAGDVSVAQEEALDLVHATGDQSLSPARADLAVGEASQLLRKIGNAASNRGADE